MCGQAHGNGLVRAHCEGREKSHIYEIMKALL